jgi:lysozyme family protein
MTVDQIIDEIVQREGGYTNNVADRGGPTKYGITAVTLGEWRHMDAPASELEVESLSDSEARTILRQRYIVGPGLVQIRDERLRALVADTLVQHGLRGGTIIVQRGVGVPGDGVMGPQTIAALNANDVFNRVLASRLRKYGRILSDDHTQAEFAAGWMNRCAGMLEESA